VFMEDFREEGAPDRAQLLNKRKPADPLPKNKATILVSSRYYPVYPSPARNLLPYLGF
jgi:hypothetical protein